MIIKFKIFEEFLGQFTMPIRGELIQNDVYKNPKSISRMDASIRGLSDSDGNLYVIDNSMYATHSNIAIWLMAKNYIKYPGSVYKNLDKIALWQRDGKSNDFLLSHSYEKDFVMEHIPEIKELMGKVQLKNPQFNFIFKGIEGEIFE